MKSKDFIFRSTAEGELEFHGDFEGYYQNVEDPWGQSGEGEMADYYQQSREQTLSLIQKYPHQRILEIGCGLGYTTEQIHTAISATQITGVDISATAIEKARMAYPHLQFECADIGIAASLTPLQGTYDVIILNQLLWYILEQLPDVLQNIHQLLSDNGVLIISNAFARNQKYGNHIINGYTGAYSYFSQQTGFRLVESCFFDHAFEHMDGHFVMIKQEPSAYDK